MKKLISVLLILIIALSAVSCGNANSDENAPEGMVSATIAGEPFTLYVPTYWKSNTASGISSAFYSALGVSDKVSVSARYTSAEGKTVEGYIESAVAELQSSYANSGFELAEGCTATLLGSGSADARRFSYKMDINEEKLLCTQTVALHNGDLIILSTYCPDADVDTFKEDFDKIQKNLVLGTRPVSSSTQLTDKNTPEGMQIASNESLEYTFYVPKTWVCNAESGATEAHFPESGSPNVTVTSYVPEGSMSIYNFFALCESDLTREFGDNYSRIENPTERKIDGKKAVTYTYNVKIQDKEIKILQSITIFDGAFYSVTYTALAESFDSHIDDVNKMLDNLKFD